MDDEVVALIACLRMVALFGADETGQAALSALTKVEQTLPPRLHAIVSALGEATRSIPQARPTEGLGFLRIFFTAQEDCTLIRLDYRRPNGETRAREIKLFRAALGSLG